jgi:hypothetical protein
MAFAYNQSSEQSDCQSGVKKGSVVGAGCGPDPAKLSLMHGEVVGAGAGKKQLIYLRSEVCRQCPFVVLTEVNNKPHKYTDRGSLLVSEVNTEFCR